jgi:seryl-tRNA synthetase
MLQVAFIRDYKGTVLKGLAKRNFANAEVVLNDVLSIDDERKSTQTQLDNLISYQKKLEFFIKTVNRKKQLF